jgi:hypothetical protein
MRVRVVLLALLGATLALPAVARAQQAPTDCQENFDCLIRAALTCTPARATRTAAIAGQGMILTATIAFEIRGPENTLCVFHQRTERASMRFDDEMFQRFMNAGLTREQVLEEEAQYNRRYAALAASQDGTCRLPSNELMTLLIRVNTGEYVPLDEYRDRCEGPLFNPPGA